MNQQAPHKVLVADDDPSVRETLAMVLSAAGYEVATAEHGIDAIFLLQRIVPDVVIYELNMPQVPGYDFLAIVRTRFPRICVLAMSSSTALDGNVPDGVFADGMYIKGVHGPEHLLKTLAGLIETSTRRAADHIRNGAQAFARNQRARRRNA